MLCQLSYRLGERRGNCMGRLNQRQTRVLIVAALCCGAMGIGTAAAADDVRDEIEQHLRNGLLEVWFPRCLDRENGGVLWDFDCPWPAAGGRPTPIVFPGRHNTVAGP